MSTYYCHSCTLIHYPIPQIPVGTNLTGSADQLQKFLKHTTAPYSGTGVESKYFFTDYPTYAYYLHQTIQSGSLEIDGWNRHNFLLQRTASIGLVFHPTIGPHPVNVIKVVLPYDLTKIHHFATASSGIITAQCNICSHPIM